MMAAQRYAKANNPYLKDFNEEMEKSYIMYLDCNNLYGAAMSVSLPYKNIRWSNDITIDNVMNINPDGNKGYIIECDLEYPEELHDLHNNYPLAPEKMIITNDMLSEHTREIQEFLKIKEDTNAKLVCTLNKKTNYITHIKNLQLYIRLGLKLTKIHRSVSFSQKKFLEPYISFNTIKRNEAKKAKDEFGVDFFKLLNNSVYGKTCENVRGRINFKLIQDEYKLVKYSSKFNYKSHIIFGNDEDSIVGIHMNKTKVTLNKPQFIGACVLDLSKTIMYDFHYNFMMKKYPLDDIKLLMTDTDSLVYYIKTNDLYKDLLNNNDRFDFNNYPPDHELYNTNNNIGMFKDEYPIQNPISEFVGLRSKMYAINYQKGESMKESKKCKGVQGSVVTKDIKFNDYYNTLMNENNYIMMHKTRSFKSINHEIYTYEMKKTSLSTYDNKRYILDDNINSYSYGHYRTKQ